LFSIHKDASDITKQDLPGRINALKIDRKQQFMWLVNGDAFQMFPAREGVFTENYFQMSAKPPA
jgi:hypothetical protein